jgi:MFS family permease
MADERGTQRLEQLHLLRVVFRNPDMRRVQVALGVITLAGSAYQVGLAVFASQVGGPRAVGIAFAVQVLPLTFVAPFTSAVADRFPRRTVMIAVDLIRCTCTALVAVAIAAGGSLALVLALGAFGTVASTTYDPATRALLPSLVREPLELTAANAVSGGIYHAGLLLGPALAGLLIGLAGAAWGFAVGAALFGVSALLIVGVRVRGEPPEPSEPDASRRSELLAGLRTITADPSLRVLVTLYAAVSFAFGAVQVFTVVLAQDLTGLGTTGVGVLFAAMGAGGVIGALAAVGLTGKRRLSAILAAGVLAWGVPLALHAARPTSAAALVAMVVIGFGNVLVDVSIVTIFQRAVPDNVLGRVFGILETVLVGMIGIGSLVAPLLGTLLGNRGALVAVGALLPVLVGLLWPRLRTLDVGSPEQLERAALLRQVSIFEPLSEPILETLARQLQPLTFADGHVVIRQGDEGDLYYVIEDGTVEVTVDGEFRRTLGPADGFGEIALLRDVPRTSTVTARGDVRLYSLEREVFLDAVTGNALSAAAAEGLVTSRLGPSLPRPATR